MKDGRAKAAVIGLRFTPDEKSRISKEAKRHGQTVTDYLKAKLQES